MKKKLPALFSIIMAVILLCGCSFGNNKKADIVVLSATEEQARIAEISRDYVDAVVTVMVIRVSDDVTEVFGSGVIVHENGFVATNFHVISRIVYDINQAYKLKVTFNSSDYLYTATIEWTHVALDLAVLKVQGNAPAYVPMKDRFIFAPEEESLYALEKVIAIGTPISYSYKSTVTLGTISSKEKRISHSDGNAYEDLIQHTAFINHGNSGGGLFDLHGNLIGLNTLGYDNAHGLFFAVAIYPIIEIIDNIAQAYENGKKFEIGKLGIEAVDKHQAGYFDSDFSQSGLCILNVYEEGASHGLLQVNDVITKIKLGSETHNVNIRNDFIYQLLKTQKGTAVQLTVIRDGANQTVNLVLG